MVEKRGSRLKEWANELHMVLVDELSVPCLQIKGNRLAQDKELAFPLEPNFYFSPSVFRGAMDCVSGGCKTWNASTLVVLFAV